MKRPLLWGFVTLCLGIVAVYYRFPVWALLGFVALLIGMPFFLREIKITQTVFVLGLFGLGAFLGYGVFPDTDVLENLYQKDVSLIGVVTDYPIRTENRLTINLTAKELVATTDENNRREDATGIRATIYYQVDEETIGAYKGTNIDAEQQLEFAPGDVLLLQG
ncbi:MAG: hypothetical protein CVV01_04920, partial [Firmicutes bacterium HGW-Firmicutes-6]